MKTELKDLIIKKTQENLNEFQTVNFIIDSFKAYIYDDKGEYLVGGQEVAEFITSFCNLYISK